MRRLYPQAVPEAVNEGPHQAGTNIKPAVPCLHNGQNPELANSADPLIAARRTYTRCGSPHRTIQTELPHRTAGQRAVIKSPSHRLAAWPSWLRLGDQSARLYVYASPRLR